MPPSESSTNAQQPENRYPRKYSDAELLGALRQLLKERGDLSRRIIAESTNMRSAGTYDARFGCLTAAYRMIGFTPNRNDYGPVLKDRALRRPRPGGLVPEQMLEALRRLLKKHGYLTDKLIEKSEAVPAPTSYCRHFGGLLAAYRLIGYTPDPRRLRALRRPEGRSVPDQALLVSLREVLQRRGWLSNTIIDQERSLACSMTYINRFGSLRNAYGLIGYTPDRYQTRYNRPRGLSNQEILDALRRLWQKKGRLSIEIIDRSPEVPSYKVLVSRLGCLSRAYALIGYPSKRRLRMKSLRLSNEAMLKKLRGPLKANGYPSGLLIERSVSLPTRSTYVTRFGGLKRAYRLIGYKPDFYRKLSPRPRGLGKEKMLAVLRRLLKRHGRLSQEIMQSGHSRKCIETTRMTQVRHRQTNFLRRTTLLLASRHARKNEENLRIHADRHPRRSSANPASPFVTNRPLFVGEA